MYPAAMQRDTHGAWDSGFRWGVLAGIIISFVTALATISRTCL